MSACACIVFFGLRFELSPETVELLDSQDDPRIRAAKEKKLDVYWANFGGVDERYLLFVGKRIGIFGPENSQEAAVGPMELHEIMTSTEGRLTSAGLVGLPRLFIHWEEDV